jgi:hypothetical protein
MLDELQDLDNQDGVDGRIAQRECLPAARQWVDRAMQVSGNAPGASKVRLRNVGHKKPGGGGPAIRLE